MDKIYIIVVDDQREVLDAVSGDLSDFEEKFKLEECETAQEAEELLEEIYADGDFAALIISDHVMPEKSGVEFLKGLHMDERFHVSKKILLTGLATHQDTIEAINAASIDGYIEKPWKKEKLVQMVKELLTRYITDQGIDYENYIPLLDQPALYAALKKRT